MDEVEFGERSYHFTEPVPHYLVCSICMAVLKEAVATDCCGKTLCKDHYRSRDSVDSHGERARSCSCPFCRKTSYTVTANKGIDSIVSDLKVYCNRRKNGCEWTGHLVFALDHKATCEYEPVPCSNGCGMEVQRRHLTAHCSQGCPKRPATNETVKTCPFSNVLCRKKTSREEDMRQHLQSCVGQHLVLVHQHVLQSGERLRADMQKEIDGLKRQVEGLKVENASILTSQRQLQEEVKKLTTAMITVNKKVASTEKQAPSPPQGTSRATAMVPSPAPPLQPWKAYLQSLPTCTSSQLPTVLRFTGVQEYTNGARGYTWTSPSFYTTGKGYNMCMSVIPDGLELAQGTHVSIQFSLMPGKYDGQLEWPFNGSVNVEILNQLGDYNHCTKTIYFERFPVEFAERQWNYPQEGEVPDGWGILRFISKNQLGKEGNRQYLSDDTLYIRVTLVSEYSPDEDDDDDDDDDYYYGDGYHNHYHYY